MSGLRRGEAESRAGSPIVSRDLRGLVKISPIATWTDEDVDASVGRDPNRGSFAGQAAIGDSGRLDVQAESDAQETALGPGTGDNMGAALGLDAAAADRRAGGVRPL